jgi:hypothetical protein
MKTPPSQNWRSQSSSSVISSLSEAVGGRSVATPLKWASATVLFIVFGLGGLELADGSGTLAARKPFPYRRERLIDRILWRQKHPLLLFTNLRTFLYRLISGAEHGFNDDPQLPTAKQAIQTN